jgi:hypothetical protein
MKWVIELVSIGALMVYVNEAKTEAAVACATCDVSKRLLEETKNYFGNRKRIDIGYIACLRAYVKQNSLKIDNYYPAEIEMNNNEVIDITSDDNDQRTAPKRKSQDNEVKVKLEKDERVKR